jgi:hypothetical protein
MNELIDSVIEELNQNPTLFVTRALLEKVYNEGVLEGVKLAQNAGIPKVQENKFDGNKDRSTLADFIQSYRHSMEETPDDKE